MRTRILALLPVWILLVADNAAAGLRLWGQVKLDGRPAPQARVVADGQDTCWCDASGNYSFPSLRKGPLALQVSSPGGEPARVDLWLRSDHFLELNLRSLRHPADGFPADSLASALPRPPRWDIDQDGQPDRLGWRGLGRPAQRLEAGLPSEDPWLGLWPAVAGTADATWEPDGRRGFFSDHRASGWSRVDESAPPRAAVRLEGGSVGQQAGLAGSWPIGLWQNLDAWADAGVQRTGLVADGGLRHRWTLPRGFQLSQTVVWNQRRRDDLDTRLAALWWPAASADALREAELTQRQWSWSGRLAVRPAEATATELLAWVRGRKQTGQGLEWERLSHRMLVDGSEGWPSHVWFDTRRTDRRTAGGLRWGLRQEHARGWLEAALGMENHLRRTTAALAPVEAVGTGLDPWFSAREQAVQLEGRLLDRWSWLPQLSLEAALDLRYSFYELRREAVGLFQLSDVPEVGFNQDLLALEPRLALLGRLGDWNLEAAWSRRQSMTDPSEAWDLGRNVERLADEPLVAAIGSTDELETLLPSRRLDQVELTGQRAWGPAELSLELAGRLWRHLPAAGWTPQGESFDPDQLVRPLDAAQGLMAGRLRLRPEPWRLELAAQYSRARFHGTLWRPLADTTVWVGRDTRSTRLPGGEPAWTVEAALERSWRVPGGWRVAPRLELTGCGPRDPENQMGWRAETPAAWWLDARLEGSLRTWSVTVWGRNLGAEPAAATRWLAYTPETRVHEDLRLEGGRRAWGVSVGWRP